jgi:hypothetical protein
MKWTVEREPEADFVRVVTSGDFSVDDHRRMIEDIVARPYWRPGTDVLFDHRRMDLSRVGYAAMEQASESHVRYGERIGDGRAAIVVRSAVDYGSARQFEMLTEHQAHARLRVFLDAGEAEDWIRSDRERGARDR